MRTGPARVRPGPAVRYRGVYTCLVTLLGFLPVLAHVGGTEEITYVFLPAVIFFVVFRLVRGKQDPPEQVRPQDRLREGRRG